MIYQDKDLKATTHVVEELIEKWEKDTEYLKDLSPSDKKVLAVILENQRLYHIASKEPVLSLSQMLWLTQQGWLRSKFRNMVSVQPMMGPCALAFYVKVDTEKKATYLVNQAVASTNENLGFSIFNKADFESVKDVYADALAHENDSLILKKLPKISIEHLMEDDNIIYQGSNRVDYIIAPQNMLDKISKKPHTKGINLFPTPEFLNEDWDLYAAAGKYKYNIFELPIYMPYGFLTIAKPGIKAARVVSIRSGWLTESDLKEEEQL